VNILFVGEKSAGIHTLKALTESGHRIVAVMASPPKNGGGLENLWETAEKLGHRTWPTILIIDPRFADEMRAAEADIILNIHSLFIINRRGVKAPRAGCFNMHPGPLPRYAGLNAVSFPLGTPADNPGDNVRSPGDRRGEGLPDRRTVRQVAGNIGGVRRAGS